MQRRLSGAIGEAAGGRRRRVLWDVGRDPVRADLRLDLLCGGTQILRRECRTNPSITSSAFN